MIISQKETALKTKEAAFLLAQAQLQALCRIVEQRVQERKRLDEVERELFASLLSIGRTMLEAFVAAQGDGDAGDEAELADGRRVRRSDEPHARRYLSIFGELEIFRFVYAIRVGQKIEHAPLDAKLGLPEGEFSYVLEDWLQRLCVQQSFGEAVAALREWLGVAPSERAAEEMNRRMATDATAFQVSQGPPTTEPDAKILVATADGKGVPMRRPLAERVRASQPRRGKGEKANKKQMAYVGAVYSIAPFVRSVDDVLDEVLRHERGETRPRPQHKQVWAEMTRHHEGDNDAGVTGRMRTFVEMAVACHTRDPDGERTLVCLMDGERPLWDMAGEWLPRAIGVLDLFHVLERLWLAAYCFHAERSVAAADFVSHHLRMLLEGKVGYVIGGLRRLAQRHSLTGSKLKTLNAVITYYDNNRDHMRYDEYLAAGYPIGSGVAEGACRHLVKDRLEQTGMRWTTAGAQAMLHLRAIHINDCWRAYLNFHIQAEQARLYGNTAA